MYHDKHISLDLRMFDEGGGSAAPAGSVAGATPAAPAAGSAPATAASAPTQGTQAQDANPQKTDAERRAEFAKLIKGDYKDLYDESVKSHVDRRFKERQGIDTELESSRRILQKIAMRKGVDPSDMASIETAIDNDDDFFESEAIKRGMPVNEVKELYRLKAENDEFMRQRDEANRRQQADQTFQKWIADAEKMKAIYPTFDLEGESSSEETGERFVSLLRAGIDVKTAYEIIHKDEIIGGAMAYTAQQVQAQTVADIRARGMRAPENGAGAPAAGQVAKKSPDQMTRAEREDAARRAMMGERVTFR